MGILESDQIISKMKVIGKALLLELFAGKNYKNKNLTVNRHRRVRRVYVGNGITFFKELGKTLL